MSLELEEARAELARHRENRARLAVAYARFDSDGQGTIEFETRVDFGLTFVEEPFPTYGAKVDLDALGDALGLDEDTTPPLPLSTGYVTEWDTDDRGFYTGAWVAATVWDPSGTILDADIPITHYFTFQAVGMKDIPLDVTN